MHIPDHENGRSRLVDTQLTYNQVWAARLRSELWSESVGIIVFYNSTTQSTVCGSTIDKTLVTLNIVQQLMINLSEQICATTGVI